MATVTCRSAPRLLTCLRSTTTLRPHARTPTPAPRTITSFQGLQGLVQPYKVAALETHQAEETSDAMSLHLEALSHWHQEAEKMRQQRVDPAAAVDEVNVVALTHEQVVELLDDLVQDYLLDIRQGWIATTEY